MDYCSLCHHAVQDMEKHLTTEEHSRKLRQLRPGGVMSPSRRYMKTGCKRHYGSHILKIPRED